MPFFSSLSLNKKCYQFYFPLSISSNDIQLKIVVFVEVIYAVYNNNE